jgi:hypothetical protein
MSLIGIPHYLGFFRQPANIGFHSVCRDFGQLIVNRQVVDVRINGDFELPLNQEIARQFAKGGQRFAPVERCLACEADSGRHPGAHPAGPKNSRTNSETLDAQPLSRG